MTNNATVLISENILKTTADAIRNKGGASGPIKPINFAETIKAIAAGGLDTSDATATAAEILSGETAYVNGRKLIGAMPNNGVIFSTMDGIEAKSVSIPSGYTDGGTISLTDDIDNEVGTQADLIEAITVALEGKGAGGNCGESAEDAILSGQLSGVYVNDRINVLKGGAFTGCENLTSVNFPNCSIISGFRAIGNYEPVGAFQYCSNLTSVSFPACTTIGFNAFYKCDKLSSVNFPACTVIDSGAFRYCERLTSVSFPVCTVINSRAFTNCNKLTFVNFPACTVISHYAFEYCNNLTSVSFPVCTTIRATAFGRCNNLTSVSFPVCTTIGDGAFTSCSNLTSVNFPACTTIGSDAFGSCSNLISVSFSACTMISRYAFIKCYKLSNVQLGTSSVCTLSNSNAFSSTPFAGYSAYFSGTPYIYVPSSLITAYQSATNWTYFSSYFSAIEEMGDDENDDNTSTETIGFTINGASYLAVDGMNWAEWVESEYNTLNAYINNDMNVVFEKDNAPWPGVTTLWISEDSEGRSYVTATDLIVSKDYYAF